MSHAMSPITDPAQQEAVRRAIARRSYCTLATASAANCPHAAGVLYAVADGDLYVSTMTSSIKARNIVANPRVAVTISMRRLPIGPPMSVHFQGTAELVASHDPRIAALIGRGLLKAVTSHGEAELPGGCFVRITPAARIVTFGVNVSLWSFLRNPLAAGRIVQLA